MFKTLMKEEEILPNSLLGDFPQVELKDNLLCQLSQDSVGKAEHLDTSLMKLIFWKALESSSAHL